MNAARLVNGILWRMEKFFSRTRIRWFKTLYIKFRTLPFSQAIRLPIWIYGPVKLYCLSGKIKIRGVIKKGMVRFGCQLGSFSAPRRGAMILLESGTELIFNGPCRFDFDYAIRITGRGVVNIGRNIWFGNDTKIYCEESITIGDYCGIPFGCCFMDTNYHYTIDLVNHIVPKKSAPIVIGSYNWIGNSSTIMKGTKTPNEVIIASKSFLNKDYTSLTRGEKYIVLAGNPVKVVRTNCARIRSSKAERDINEWFNNHSDLKEYFANQSLSVYQDVSQYHQ